MKFYVAVLDFNNDCNVAPCKNEFDVKFYVAVLDFNNDCDVAPCKNGFYDNFYVAVLDFNNDCDVAPCKNGATCTDLQVCWNCLSNVDGESCCLNPYVLT